MEMTLSLDQIINNAPTIVSGVSSVLAILLATWLKMRNVNVEEKTSAGSFQVKQIETLMSQIVMLSDELTKTRTQLSAMHEQNLKLMEELREANHRIGELEKML
jgi:uncharacterized coiled-coil protein SlyX